MIQSPKLVPCKFSISSATDDVPEDADDVQGIPVKSICGEAKEWQQNSEPSFDVRRM